MVQEVSQKWVNLKVRYQNKAYNIIEQGSLKNGKQLYAYTTRPTVLLFHY